MGLGRMGQGLRTVGVAERRARMAIRHHLAGERAGTVAAAVFTSGISLAVKAGRTVIQQNQLTVYQVT